jgi:omega-amidase
VTHDKERNHVTAQDYVAKAAKDGAQMAVLPEIWNSPYATAAFPEYAERLPTVGDRSEESVAGSASSKILRDLAQHHQMWIIGGSIPEVVVDQEGETKIYNTCLVYSPEGVVVAKHRKVHLFDIDVPGKITFFESETLSPGDTVSFFETPVGTIGVGICYDIRFAEYAMLLRQKHNCLVLVYPGAFNLTTGPAHWELLQRGRAIDNQCYVVTASPARSAPPTEPGKYPHYSAWGHSTVVSPWGDVIATTDETEGLVVADLDLSRVEEVRKSIPIGKQRREDMYKLEQQQV